MNEEIDVIELLKRVKEGNAPKRIGIGEVEYTYNENLNKILLKYSDGAFGWLEDGVVCIDTKIKILDKPIIEELEMIKSMDGKVCAYPSEETVFKKINEIIKHINKEEK